MINFPYAIDNSISPKSDPLVSSVKEVFKTPSFKNDEKPNQSFQQNLDLVTSEQWNIYENQELGPNNSPNENALDAYERLNQPNPIKDKLLPSM